MNFYMMIQELFIGILMNPFIFFHQNIIKKEFFDIDRLIDEAEEDPIF